MSYEYRNKRIIENFARRYTTNVSDEVDIMFEIELVYSQASKADEYEAKAKAFDEVLKSYEESISEGHLADDVCKIVYKYERGGSDD